jgi:hypothetical protein
MNKKPRRSSLATALTLVLCGCITTASGQQGRQPGRGEDIPLPPVGPPPVLGALPKPCNVVLAVKNSTDEHLKLGQWVQLIGPLAPGGSYLVRPVDNPAQGTPPHRWVTGVYWATNVTVNSPPDPPTSFLITKINVKGGPHPNTTGHAYTLTILSFDPADQCVKTARFSAGEHDTDEGTDQHGGHAGVER